MNKAVYFRILNYAPENLQELRKHFAVWEFADPSQLSDEARESCEIFFAPLGYNFDRDFIDRAPLLRIIATNTTGVPHIDVDYAQKKGIRVISLKGENEFLRTITPTAELTMGLMIAIVRNVPAACKSVLAGQWSRWQFGGKAMLSAMSLGIVGLGRLGSLVAGYAQAFGMHVRYYDPWIAESDVERVGSLRELTQSSDIVSLHIPMEEENRRMFDGKVFAHFRDGAYFINTARGEIVDSAALVDALQSGKLAGAAVDVLDGEFSPGFALEAGEHPLVKYAREHDNLLITPHIAGSTRDAWFKTQRYVIDKAISAAAEEIL